MNTAAHTCRNPEFWASFWASRAERAALCSNTAAPIPIESSTNMQAAKALLSEPITATVAAIRKVQPTLSHNAAFEAAYAQREAAKRTLAGEIETVTPMTSGAIYSVALGAEVKRLRAERPGLGYDRALALAYTNMRNDGSDGRHQAQIDAAKRAQPAEVTPDRSGGSTPARLQGSDELYAVVDALIAKARKLNPHATAAELAAMISARMAGPPAR